MSTPLPSPTGAPDRTPVQFDERTGDLRIGPYEKHVDDPGQPDQVYGAYLSLLYAVRRAQPGERLALRSADLEALLLLVGDDPATIESRLVALMGCTPAEAGVLGRLLLRQRRATATLGIAALSLAGVGLAAQLTGEEQVPAPTAVEQPSAPVEVAAPPAPVALVGPVPTAPLQAEPAPVPLAPAPARAAVVGPQPSAPVAAVGPQAAVAAPPAPPAPAASAPVPAPVQPAEPAPPAPEDDAPVDETPVELAPEDRVVPPLVEEPMWDAPPPVVLPESDIGDPAVLEPDPGTLTPISGVTDSEHSAPLQPISGVGDAGDHTPVVEVEPPAAEAIEAGPVPAPRHEPAEEQAPVVPQD